MKKAQSLLDFVLIFGILVGLTVGFTRIWVWFNANLAKRSVDYQNTRLAAGTAGTGSSENESRAESLVYEDKQLALNDDWIFKGKSNEGIGSPLPNSTLDVDPEIDGGDGNLNANCASMKEAAAVMRAQAADMDAQAKQLEDFAATGDDWYKPNWLLFQIMGIDAQDLKNNAQMLRQGANQTRAEAKDMVNKACSIT